MKSGSTLKIRDLVPEDSGFYKCEGENFMGKVESEISVVVEEAAPEGDGYLLIIGTFFHACDHKLLNIFRWCPGGACSDSNFHRSRSLCKEISS